jgi:malate dehydrogenase
LHDIIITCDLKEGFSGADYVFFVGSKPRGKGQERSDVLKDNALIFAEQGKFLSLYASDNCKSIVVGNPANTNAMILSANAPNVNPMNITAMTRLDHDRGLSAIASKLNCKISEIERFAIWGNHSATQYPDLTHTLVDGKWIGSKLDFDWVYNSFIPSVQQRGAAIISARGKSSATSAANAALAHMRDWIHGISDWTSMAVRGSGQYGIPGNIWSSYPVFCTLGTWQIIEGMEIDEEGAKRINVSVQELLMEREAVESLLPGKSWRGVPFDEKVVYSWSHLFDSASEKVQPTLLGDFEFQDAWKAQVGASLSFFR